VDHARALPARLAPPGYWPTRLACDPAEAVSGDLADASPVDPVDAPPAF